MVIINPAKLMIKVNHHLETKAKYPPQKGTSLSGCAAWACVCVYVGGWGDDKVCMQLELFF